jgi:hypothetical protein
MLRLEDLIGQKVIIALLGSKNPAGYDVILHGVENGGLWVESPELAQGSEVLLPPQKKGQPTQKVVFFFPYARIQFLVASGTDLEGRV